LTYLSKLLGALFYQLERNRTKYDSRLRDRLIDINACNVPAWCEAGLVEDYRPLGVGDNTVTMADHQPSGSLADVDAMVAVGGMAQNPLVFFIEGIDRRPCG